MNSLRKIKVAVDLTPMRPGGENGGAKILVLTLLKEFSLQKCACFEYLIITESWNHEEIVALQAGNITCIPKSEIFSVKRPIIDGFESGLNLPKLILKWSTFQARRLTFVVWKIVKRLESYLPSVFYIKHTPGSECPKIFALVIHSIISFAIHVLRFYPGLNILQEKHRVDLLFCPFSSPNLSERGLPIVSTIYDLQHLDIPDFFDKGECLIRTRFLEDLSTKANRIICISDFTRQSYLNYFHVVSDKLICIPVCIHERLKHQTRENVTRSLDKLGLAKRPYLFFPANFWPHKNHCALLEAYSRYWNEYSLCEVDLVFTGALESAQKDIESIANTLGLRDNIHFMGFLSENEVISIWQGSQGLIFPSLYEGFGIPLLEAMWFQKPIACSKVASLYEVGGDAAIYFDPKNLEEMAVAMARIIFDELLVKELILNGQKRLHIFDQKSMAKMYLETFEIAVESG
ncbi:glycosyltransferase family 4 protein [Leptolyngbya sp. KIOST-1]|uniref:glycosyltransferase family 4 protein n=1 Tax=Leptolyngbya sp. KIOST-1 TaxID=1229172 RepID=UPI0009DCA0AD|nr:glycosyltransferase family 1 protein [Leptolyngbya sp. KIOST-1]